jgi:hypothetical protein
VKLRERAKGYVHLRGKVHVKLREGARGREWRRGM